MVGQVRGELYPESYAYYIIKREGEVVLEGVYLGEVEKVKRFHLNSLKYLDVESMKNGNGYLYLFFSPKDTVAKTPFLAAGYNHATKGRKAEAKKMGVGGRYLVQDGSVEFAGVWWELGKIPRRDSNIHRKPR